jgi:ubiquinone/menaquinone biosynthesis C-methylase UbiE
MTTYTTDKAEQADYYDHNVADREFEINRPHGESRLYRYLMDFKFSRVASLLSRPLRGSEVLVICCGSGMDAEYVVRAGASVVAMDISDGCLDRARIRADRYGLSYDLVRGDAENLPFATGTFDYGFVHDGLHHLTQPDRAIAELARIARRGIIVTEPADAAITKLLIRLGVMQPYEEAGNFVIRFRSDRLESVCRSLGFDRISSSRYLVKYGHPPAAWWRRFDSTLPFLAARAGFFLFGVALLGRWGNKLAFVAERARPAVDSSA